MVALVIALATAISTDAPVAPAQEQTGASRIALATISDPRNRPIVDVSADDFVIQEAGAAREILSVRPGDYPIASIVDSGAILHVVANRAVQAAAGGGFRPGAAIRALAEQSRGEFTAIYNAASFQAALDRLADRVAGEMMIEYLVPVGSKPS